jgi:hypothetical protein
MKKYAFRIYDLSKDSDIIVSVSTLEEAQKMRDQLIKDNPTKKYRIQKTEV